MQNIDSVTMRFAISALTDDRLKNRHTGVDTFKNLIDLCEQQGKKILLLGASDEILEKAKTKLLQSHENLIIDILDPDYLLIRSGWIYVRDEIIDEIHKINPDVVAIALSHKKQLIFMNQFKDEFPDVKVMIGVGGAIDMIAGKRKRAPRLMQKMGLEWIWRALIEPSRIGRIILASIFFPIYVVSEAIKNHRFIKAVMNTVPEIAKQLIGK
ncbi:MAG: Glycosyltransferase WecB/TagA/CpsF family protein [Candidatus Uhrbacteria bacterium GW2011_GWE2_41_1153]|nr:MAG: Glycosyltransferase WecB/TagA/CpsF family protein [Candidatus Uhrbacteria bacterium GW2011_GWE2_41_1153]